IRDGSSPDSLNKSRTITRYIPSAAAANFQIGSRVDVLKSTPPMLASTSYTSCTSVGVSPFGVLATDCTTMNGSVGTPSRAEITSIQYASPFFTLNVNQSRSPRG